MRFNIDENECMRILKKFNIILLIFFFAGFIWDIFFIPLTPNSYTDWVADIRLFIFLILWIFIERISSFTSIATFKLTLLFLIIFSILFVFFRQLPAIERVGSWIYIFLATGVIQQLFEAKHSLRDRNGG